MGESERDRKAVQPHLYEIRVAGQLDSERAGWFDDLELRTDRGESVLFGPIADQAALHSVLTRIRNLGLHLVAVQRSQSGSALSDLAKQNRRRRFSMNTNQTGTMGNTKLARRSAGALIGAGIASAVFWLLTLPFESFAGAEVALDPLFGPGQVVHVLAATLTLFGYIGLYLSQSRETGRLGYLGFILAFLGAAFFLVDGVIALIVIPALARVAPELVEATGAMNTGSVLTMYIVFAATNTIGIVLFGAAIWRAAIYPRAAALLYIFGGIMFNLPPVLPHLILVLGGVIWGIGAAWLGYGLWAMSGKRTPREAGQPLAGAEPARY